MSDQIGLDSVPLVISSNPGDGTPPTAAVHPPDGLSYGPGSASATAGSGSTPVDPQDLPGSQFPIAGTGDRGGTDPLASRGPQQGH